MNREKTKQSRPEAYPRPTETDKQLDSQDEFIPLQNDKKNNEKPVLKEESDNSKITKEDSPG